MAKRPPKPPINPSGGKGKKQGNSKGTIKIALKSKIEELIRTSELDMLLQRYNLGLEPKGDMSDFIKDLIRNLKKRKKR